MKLTISPYLAGLATAAIAITAGFGGGVLIADRVDTNGAVPAPGMSRIERTKREEPKPASAATEPGQSQQALPEGINPLAEATPAVSSSTGPEVVASSAHAAGSVQTRGPAPSEIRTTEVALPAAIKAIQDAPHHGQRITASGREPRSSRRSRTAQRANGSEVQSAAPKYRAKVKDAGREIARYREGNVRYVVRTPNGNPADPSEVLALKRELRARREVAETGGRALSYGPERGGVFSRIFPD